MKIGIIREGKTPPDKRVPFTPKQCQLMVSRYPQLELVVQSSPIRAFSDQEYRDLGITVQEDISDSDVIFGVKEVPIAMLHADKTHFFFSHTIKEQPYNRKLLLAIMERSIKMVDYECLTDKKGKRLVGFGRYAGIVGTYNGLLAYGKTTNAFGLKAANLCADRVEMEGELEKVNLPRNFKIVLTGTGRVGKGALEILRKLNLKEVKPKEFLNEAFNEPVYTVLGVKSYNKRIDGGEFKTSEFYESPEQFESNFYRFAQLADMYIPCHYWDSEAPFIFTKEDMKKDDFKIRTIADISCDIDGPVASTIRPSTIADPIYFVNRLTGAETTEINADTITVMAVDNLPCELPKDASEDFGNELINNILPNLLGTDNDRIIYRATITERGELNDEYEYLQGYVEG
jgi:alanine dehydrogenase